MYEPQEKYIQTKKRTYQIHCLIIVISLTPPHFTSLPRPLYKVLYFDRLHPGCLRRRPCLDEDTRKIREGVHGKQTYRSTFMHTCIHASARVNSYKKSQYRFHKDVLDFSSLHRVMIFNALYSFFLIIEQIILTKGDLLPPEGLAKVFLLIRCTYKTLYTGLRTQTILKGLCEKGSHNKCTSTDHAFFPLFHSHSVQPKSTTPCLLTLTKSLKQLLPVLLQEGGFRSCGNL